MGQRNNDLGRLQPCGVIGVEVLLLMSIFDVKDHFGIFTADSCIREQPPRPDEARFAPKLVKSSAPQAKLNRVKLDENRLNEEQPRIVRIPPAPSRHPDRKPSARYKRLSRLSLCRHVSARTRERPRIRSNVPLASRNSGQHQGMNTEKTNGECTPPAVTSFSPARISTSSVAK
jgi:hypothetical protein